METMTETRTSSVNGIVQQVIEPYELEIQKLKEELDLKNQEVDNLNERLSYFDHLKVLLERKDETFHLRINDQALLQKLIIVIDQYRLYPVLQRDYIEWKTNGGKRPKDPIRQCMLDVMATFVERPSLLVGAIRASAKYDSSEFNSEE